MRRRAFAIGCLSAVLAGCSDVEGGDERATYSVDRQVPASIDDADTDSRTCPSIDRAPPADVSVDAAERYARSLATAQVLADELDGEPPSDGLDAAVVTAAERDGGVRVDVAVRWPSEEAPQFAVLAAASDVADGDLPRRSVDALDLAADGPVARAADSVLETGTERRLHGEPAAALARAVAESQFLLARDGDAVRVRISRVPDRTVVSHYRFVDDRVEWSPRVDFRRSRPVAVPADAWIELAC